MSDEDRPERSLTAYGASTRPQVRKGVYVDLDGRQVGLLGKDVANDARVYVSERHSEQHRYWGEDPNYDLSFEGEGYALSLDLFERIDGFGAGRVYIPETDTGDVYYFGFQQFVEGDHINTKPEARGRGREKDIQAVVPVDEAVQVWRGAYPGLYAKTM